MRTGSKKCWFLGKFCVRTNWMIPNQDGSKFHPHLDCLWFEWFPWIAYTFWMWAFIISIVVYQRVGDSEISVTIRILIRYSYAPFCTDNICILHHHIHRYQSCLNFLHHFRRFYHSFCWSCSVLIHGFCTLHKYSTCSSFHLNCKNTLQRLHEDLKYDLASLI